MPAPKPKNTLPLTGGSTRPETNPGLMETGFAMGKTQATLPERPPVKARAKTPNQQVTLPNRTLVSPNHVPPPQGATNPASTHVGATFVQELAATMAGTGAPPSVGGTVSTHTTQTTELEHRLLGYGGQPGKIDRFVILRKLGEGGMGMVFSAFDEDLDRRVAIKLLLDEGMTGTQGRSRIRREAQAMAKLNHPNVVQVYEVREWEGKIYVVMEYVKGETLGDWTHDHERGWRDVLEMNLQAGRGVAAAHAVGIIHRDYKPDNVLVGDDGRARVLDFGLARATRVSESGTVDPGSSVVGRIPTDRTAEINTQLTMAGTIMGTPAYMSPEQHLGAATDAHSDQFSFCVALYEGLYKQRPYEGDTLAALAAAVTDGEIIPPPKSTEVPPAVWEIIKRGLSPNKGERFESMDTLLAELAHVLDPVAVGGFARYRWPIITAAAVVLAIGVTAALTWGGAPTPEEELLVNGLVEEARKAASEAHWVYPALDGEVDATSIRKVKTLEDLDGAAKELGKAKATELRDTFFATLTGLGDRYWENKASRAYAGDYYLQALLFKDDDEIRERLTVTNGELLDFRLKALKDGFTQDEIRKAGMLFALAETDDEKREQRILAELDALKEQFSSYHASLLDGLVDAELSEEKKTTHRRKRAKRAAAAIGVEVPEDTGDDTGDADSAGDSGDSGDSGEADSEGADSGETGDSGDTGDAEVEEPKPSNNNGGKKNGKKKRPRKTDDDKNPGEDKEPEQVVDKELSDELAKQGQAALARGALKEAESLFNQSLSANNRNAAALAGLSDVFFERSAHRRAVKFAEKAVRIAPSNASYRIRLGDAYFKVLRYADARKAYEKAKSLGSSKAASRLAKVKQQLGE